MSRGLKYEDLNASEQLTYKALLSQINHNPALHTQTSPPAGQRFLGAWVKFAFAYGKRLFARYTRQPTENTRCVELEQFIRTQASSRGFDTFERDSFPHFPDGIDPFHSRVNGDRDTAEYAYPEALHHIITTFREASPARRLELLVAYAENLPELPEALQQARDTMEQVDECQIPVFLLAQLREGQVHYYIDVPRDAPTMRGFAGLLYAGLHGATPAAIAATPSDLCQQLGLHKALSSLRLYGLTALLNRMKRNARELASAV